MFRPSRNFKVPQVSGGQWKDHQTFQKWDPISKRLVQVACCAPTVAKGGGGGPCPAPDAVDFVTLSNISASGVDVSWTYGGHETIFEVNVWQSSSSPVDTSGIPIYSEGGAFTSPYSVLFPSGAIENYYYVASVRVKNDCGYSSYVYSDSIQYSSCPAPDPAVSVTLANLTSTGGDVTFIYAGSEPVLVLEIYESATSPVDTSGSPLINFIGSLVSPNTYTFTTTAGYYYKAGLRVRHDCGGGNYSYSSYVYSGEVQYNAALKFLSFGASSTSPKYYISGSYDGTTWSQTPITGDSFANFANDGAYDSANTRWIAVGGTTAPCALISDDSGLTWSSTGLTGFFLTNATGIAHNGSGRWVATGYFNPGLLLTSTNGTTWSTVSGDSFGVGGSLGRGVAYSGGTWIAVGKTQSGGYPILRSTNGTTWTGVSSASFEGYKVAYGNGIWIAVGEGTDTIYRSTDDGLTWTAVSGYGFSTRGQGIAYGNGRWIAVGLGTGYNMITSTDDGLTWSNVGTYGQYFGSNGGYDVLYKDSLWLVCGDLVNFSDVPIKKSTDGTTWVNCSGDTFGTGSVFGLGST